MADGLLRLKHAAGPLGTIVTCVLVVWGLGADLSVPAYMWDRPRWLHKICSHYSSCRLSQVQSASSHVTLRWLNERSSSSIVSHAWLLRGYKRNYCQKKRADIGTFWTTLQEENFHWNLNFAFSLMANSLNLNSAYYYTFRNLSMKASMIEI